MKSGVLHNWLTGEVEEYSSISSWVARHPELGPNGINHMYPVVNRKRPHHVGWGLHWPEPVLIQDIYDNVYSAENPLKFSQKYQYLKTGYSPSCTAIWNLCSGKRKCLMGLHLLSHFEKYDRPRAASIYNFEVGGKALSGTATELAEKLKVNRRMIYYYAHGLTDFKGKYLGMERPKGRGNVLILADTSS